MTVHQVIVKEDQEEMLITCRRDQKYISQMKFPSKKYTYLKQIILIFIILYLYIFDIRENKTVLCSIKKKT